MNGPIRQFSLREYVDAAIELIEYERDEDGVIVALVPNIQGYYSQGATYDEARSHLRDAIEQIVMLRLQLGWEIATIPGVEIKEAVLDASA